MSHAWGVDVSTRRLAIAAAPLDGGRVLTWSRDFAPSLRDGERLHAIRTACHRHIPLPRPGFIVVENPKTIRGGAILVMVAGVVVEGLFGRYRVATWDVPIPTWKKEILGNGNADKSAIMLHAGEALAASPANQDEADAACIAAYARRQAVSSA